jgi:hypothetical protein
MTTPTTSFRLPTETLDRLRALARPGESLSGVIVRAALALEAAPVLAPLTEPPRNWKPWRPGYRVWNPVLQL